MRAMRGAREADGREAGEGQRDWMEGEGREGREGIRNTHNVD